jgi:hypothetical protein
MKLTLSACLILSLCITPAFAIETETVIGKFSSGDLTGWKEQTIWGAKNYSTYALVQDSGKTVLQGKSTDAASGLLHKVDLDPKTSSFIKWSWKIDHTVKKGNEKIKDGHDFAVRLYVVFPRGLFSSHRAIEYVWGNVMAKGDILKSPFTKNGAMIAVDSGNELAGKWVFHKRNFYEDYKTAFGEEPPKVGAIAIMTDSDNTHETTLGYYGDISIVSSGLKPEETKIKDTKTKEAAPKETPPKELKTKEHIIPAAAPVVPQLPPVAPHAEPVKPK